MIGRYIKIDDPDGEYWSLVRVQDQLTNRLYLVQSLVPKTGEPNMFGCWILDIKLLALSSAEQTEPRGRIFETFIALREFIDWVDSCEEPEVPAPEPVVH